ncbi:MAG TPA: AAA family ATPase [Vicinamibacteria bacterium]|nr:AAA family ATPase [Vicinamibacteria bacterium]
MRRSFWIERVERAWRRKSVVWLMGVRRVGKTFLCHSLPRTEYLDCELPRVRRELEDPEAFFEARRSKRVVLDEVHRLPDPAGILKIAADHFPGTRILATGSSTLGASARFRDTLAGRKTELWLTPMNLADQLDFGAPELRHRLHRGGLPPFFAAARPAEQDFEEWMDAYWARDILELFRLERRHSFKRFTELLLVQSGGLFEATAFSRPCEVSRQTIVNYLAVLEATFVAHVLRPYAPSRAGEIVAMPKVYGFDTGFVCHYRGWDTLRPEDIGGLWEHLVLNEIHSLTGGRNVRYWRSKGGREVDFILAAAGRRPLAIECKSKADAFEPAGLLAFRERYAEGPNLVVAPDVERSYVRRYAGLLVTFVGLGDLGAQLTEGAGKRRSTSRK